MNLISDIDEFKLKYDGTDTFIESNKLSEVVLEYYVNNYKVDWFIITIYQTLSEAFIERYIENMNWWNITMYQTLSEAFITKYNDKVSWWNITMYQTLSEAFIDKYMDKVDWYFISAYQTLSEAFIDKYMDKVDWYFISGYQTLSESFITKYSNKVDWYGLFVNDNTTLRYEFISEHLYYFNLYEVYIGIKNNINSKRLVKEYPDKYRIDKIAYEFNNNN